MDKLTQYGTEMAMCLRREAEYLREAKELGKRITELTKLIIEEDSGTLYGARATEVFEMPQTRALRSDRLDGGNTFRLNPIGDTLTSGAMSAIVSCPGDVGVTGPLCREQSSHIHTADGAVHPTVMQS